MSSKTQVHFAQKCKALPLQQKRDGTVICGALDSVHHQLSELFNIRVEFIFILMQTFVRTEEKLQEAGGNSSLVEPFLGHKS